MTLRIQRWLQSSRKSCVLWWNRGGTGCKWSSDGRVEQEVATVRRENRSREYRKAKTQPQNIANTGNDVWKLNEKIWQMYIQNGRGR